MLTRRIIPCLDVRDGRVVKGTRFLDLRDAGDPVELARHYDAEGADELAFLDITASAERRATVIELASRVAHELFIPFLVGGGVRSVEDAMDVLRRGADKISVNSAAFRDPRLIGGIAARAGSQAVVLAIDARRRSAPGSGESAWEVVIDGGRVSTGRDAVDWAREGTSLGAGEILLTSMDRDGTGRGFDLELTAAVASAIDVPVIASGGAAGPADFVTLFRGTAAEAGLAASIFHYGVTRIADVKAELARAGVPVRPVVMAEEAGGDRPAVAGVA